MEQTAVKKRILICEDEKFLRDLYIQILTDEGYEIKSASDGQEAFNAIHEGGYDLILLDILMPKLTGLDVLKKLQVEKPLKPNKKIIFLTNLGQDSAIAEGISMGVRGYLVKSDYTPDQIIKEVRGFLEEA